MIRQPRRIVPGHVIRILASGVVSGKKFIVIVVVRSNGCAAGTALSNGVCRAVVRGKG